MAWSGNESFDGLGSDLEDVSERGFRSKHLHNDYFLGLKTLECCLMKKAFDSLQSAHNDHDLNIAYANEFLHFPYQSCLQRANEILGDGYDVYGRTFTGNNSADLTALLGATYRRNPEDHAKVLFIIESTSSSDMQDRELPQTFARAASAERHARSRETFLEGTGQLPQYAMRLNEYAQSRGFRVRWDETELSLDPPNFRAATRINGRNFEGMASCKKTARHSAAKQACMTLEITNA